MRGALLWLALCVSVAWLIPWPELIAISGLFWAALALGLIPAGPREPAKRTREREL